MANLDKLVKQAQSTQNPRERGALFLDTLDTEVGQITDKAKAQELQTALKTRREPLLEAFFGE